LLFASGSSDQSWAARQLLGALPKRARKAREKASPEPKPTDTAASSTDSRGCVASRSAATSSRRRRT